MSLEFLSCAITFLNEIEWSPEIGEIDNKQMTKTLSFIIMNGPTRLTGKLTIGG